jgi:hypothetical protein
VPGDLLQAIEASNVPGASERFRERVSGGIDPWEIHQSLFPVVQRVLNPPFINPHLPKMYRICREFIPYLEKKEISPLVQLEIAEYARRPKLAKLPKTNPLSFPVAFRDIESAIGEQDWKKTADMMAAFYAREGAAELARQLLLLGSGYLEHSLGHSVSCTAFILLEMMQRKDQNVWPALVTLADYFCKGRFYIAPTIQKWPELLSDEVLEHHLLRATSGKGIVDLHHTITFYAIQRVRQLFTPEEHNHMIGAWIRFMGDKQAESVELEGSKIKGMPDYPRFFDVFARMEARPVVASAVGTLASPEGRQQLGRFLIRGAYDLYRGDYNPHYLTGLGSVLWVISQYGRHTAIATGALYQYLSFFFLGLRDHN